MYTKIFSGKRLTVVSQALCNGTEIKWRREHNATIAWDTNVKKFVEDPSLYYLMTCKRSLCARDAEKCCSAVSIEDING